MGGDGVCGYFGEQGLTLGVRNVLKGFTEGVLAISAKSVFQNGAARILKAY